MALERSSDADRKGGEEGVVSGTPTAGKRILYIADPMCSWCWGFAPVIAAIGETFGGDAPLKLVVGGLRPGETRAMDGKSRLSLSARKGLESEDRSGRSPIATSR